VVAGGGEPAGVFDAAGGTPLGTAGHCSRRLAVVDAWGVTLVDCSAPRDASIMRTPLSRRALPRRACSPRFGASGFRDHRRK